MRVTRFSVTDFLSYEAVSAEFGDGINVITGENAAGKTNLVDGIYLASVGRTSRHSKDKEVIRWGAEDGALVSLRIKKKYTDHTIDIFIDKQGKKHILIDKLPIQRIGELMGVLNIVFFSPDELKLVKESPDDRRRFLDISLSQQSKQYFYALVKYNKLLAQRNKLLKEYKGRPALNDMLKLTDTDLTRAAAFIISERQKFVNKLSPLAYERHKKLTAGAEELKLTYETDNLDFNNLEASFSELLKSSAAQDAKMEYTTKGPHKDDLKISANGIDLRKFGSQGQQRSAVLSLKLAEITLFKERTGEFPVLILDDVLSELDAQRRAALFDAFGGEVQAFITCTEFSADIAYKYSKYLVRDKKLYNK